MHRIWKRLMALALIFCIVFSLSAIVAGEDEPVLSDEELIQKYHIPDTWSRNALLFAVRNHILCGSGDGTLDPESPASRAEIATILSSALPTQHSADLTAYTDLSPTQWYYRPIGRAVAMGLIAGTGNGRMSPDSAATREQAITIIAKAFGLTDGEQTSLFPFPDWVKVSQWALSPMAAMVEAGYVAGSDGCLKPQSKITREEFAQILYSMIDRFSPQLAAEQDGTTVTYTAEIPAETIINGDLLICNDAQQMTLERVTVTGRLILQGVEPLCLTVTDCEISELTVCRPLDISLTGSTVPIAAISDTVIHGSADCITMAGGNVTVAADAEVQLVKAGQRAQGGILTVDGTLQEAQIETVLTLEGSGTIKSANIWAPSFVPELVPEAFSFTEDYGLSELEVTAESSGLPSEEEPEQTVTLSFDGKFPQGGCEIDWYLDRQNCGTDSNVVVEEGLKLAREVDFTGNFSQPTRTLYAVLRYREQTRVYILQIPVQQSNILRHISDVRTLDIPATVNYATYLYSDMNLSRQMGSVSKGTAVIYRAYRGTQAAQILLPNGTLGWVRYDAITISKADCYTEKDYSEEVKEAWVNQRGYSSQTQYLVWCNLYTQRVNIFQGEKGNWVLVFSSQCASGKNTTPTPQKVAQLIYKKTQWNYGYYYVHHVSGFDSTRGFHSMLYNYDSYTLYDDTMGRPVSHGCVRMPDEGVKYIWDNVPLYSTVVIY